MEYCYSGTESLWYGRWNRHVCRKGKCAADHHSRSTGVNPSRKQRCCSPSCLWSQAQRDTFDPDNSQSLGYWLTIRHRCICMWSWTEILFFSFQQRVTKSLFCGFITPSFWAIAYFGAFLGITFQLFKILCLAHDHWWGISTRNAHMVHIDS